MSAFPAHRFPPRGSDVLRIFDFLDLAALGCEYPHPYVTDLLDARATAACARAAGAIGNRLPSMQEDLAAAAAVVNSCMARGGLSGGAEWRWIESPREVGPYRWATLPAAWGTNVLADYLTMMMRGEASQSPAGKAINQLAELRTAILAGKTWWPAWNRAERAIARVSPMWSVRVFPIDLAPPMSPAPAPRPLVWPHSIEATA